MSLPSRPRPRRVGIEDITQHNSYTSSVHTTSSPLTSSTLSYSPSAGTVDLVILSLDLEEYWSRCCPRPRPRRVGIRMSTQPGYITRVHTHSSSCPLYFLAVMLDHPLGGLVTYSCPVAWCSPDLIVLGVVGISLVPRPRPRRVGIKVSTSTPLHQSHTTITVTLYTPAFISIIILFLCTLSSCCYSSLVMIMSVVLKVSSLPVYVLPDLHPGCPRPRPRRVG